MDGLKIHILHSPPSPQSWGDMNGQSPPELGDLGGECRMYHYYLNCSQENYRSQNSRGLGRYRINAVLSSINAGYPPIKNFLNCDYTRRDLSKFPLCHSINRCVSRQY
jgi:hypothetical protein